MSGSASLPERPSAPDLQPISRLVTRRLKDPLDMSNPDYELYLQEKTHKPTTDFIKTNKVSTPTRLLTYSYLKNFSVLVL